MSLMNRYCDFYFFVLQEFVSVVDEVYDDYSKSNTQPHRTTYFEVLEGTQNIIFTRIILS